MSEPPPPSLESLYAGTLDCVHCGLCLPSCPTYRETGRETSSPRGRIYLMRGAAEGRIALDGALADEASLCLGCRACETACPSGVRYGALLEQTRALVAQAGGRRRLRDRIEGFAVDALVPHPKRLRRLVDALAWVQRLRLDRLVAPLLPRALRDAQGLLPPIPPRAERAPLPERIPAEGQRRGEVVLFAGCIMPELFGAVNAATARVLARNGFDVRVPRGQGCCGALQAHAGGATRARELARRNLEALRLEGADALILNSAGCGAVLREYADWLGAPGRELAGGVRDVCEFLDQVGLAAPLGPVEARVCYDDPCHLVHGQGVAAAPRRLLAAVPGLELVEHRDAAACCGAAGTYNLTEPAMSRAVLARKMDALAEADPDLIASGNPGCLMQLRAGAASRGLRARVLHPVELLDAALEAGRS